MSRLHLIRCAECVESKAEMSLLCSYLATVHDDIIEAPAGS